MEIVNSHVHVNFPTRAAAALTKGARSLSVYLEGLRSLILTLQGAVRVSSIQSLRDWMEDLLDELVHTAWDHAARGVGTGCRRRGAVMWDPERRPCCAPISTPRLCPPQADPAVSLASHKGPAGRWFCQ